MHSRQKIILLTVIALVGGVAAVVALRDDDAQREVKLQASPQASASDARQVSLAIDTPVNHPKAFDKEAPAVQSSGTPASQSNVNGYDEFDRQVRERLAPPSWFYAERDVNREVAELDAGAYVGDVACGEKVCRVEVQHASAADRKRFIAALSGPRRPIGALASDEKEAQAAPAPAPPSYESDVGSATAYFYPENDLSKTILYVMKAPTIDEVFAKVDSRSGVSQ